MLVRPGMPAQAGPASRERLLFATTAVLARPIPVILQLVVFTQRLTALTPMPAQPIRAILVLAVYTPRPTATTAMFVQLTRAIRQPAARTPTIPMLAPIIMHVLIQMPVQEGLVYLVRW